MTALALPVSYSGSGGGVGASFTGTGGGGGVLVFCFLPKENVRLEFFSEKAGDDFGTGGMGIFLNGISWGDLHSSALEAVDEGAVDVALIREESSAVDAVLVFEAPLPLPVVST